jgi:hypothetical protein
MTKYIFFFGIFIALVVSVYFYQSKNWKTYVNDEIGFSFQYPPNLTLERDISRVTGQPYKTSSNWVSVIYLRQPDETYLLYVYVYDGQMTSAIRAQESLEATTRSPYKIVHITDRTIGNQPAKVVSWVRPEISESTVLKEQVFIQTPHNGTLIFSSRVGDPREKQFFEKILSTVMISGD